MYHTITDADYNLIRNLVYQHSRIALGPNKQELVAGRVKKRLRHLGLDTYSDYCRLLQSVHGQGELQGLIDAISTNFTNFFRDLKHFEFLRNEVLMKLERGPSLTTRKFRVWSAACSSGEEPYSIAVSLADFFIQRPGWAWEIEATDISTRMLDLAQAGIYESRQVKLPNPDWLRRFFQRGTNRFEGRCRVKREVREKVRFHHVNLLQSKYPFTPGFQMIFCRNVMIYFDRDTQEQLVQRLTHYLAPGGYLLVGTAESLIAINHSLRYVRPSIYQKEDRLN